MIAEAPKASSKDSPGSETDHARDGPRRSRHAIEKAEEAQVTANTKVKLLLPTVRTVKGSAGPPGKSPGNGGRLGLMREIRPADRLVRDTGKSIGDGGHLGPLGRTTNGGWSRENPPVIV